MKLKLRHRPLVDALIDNRLTRPWRPSFDRLAATSAPGLRLFEHFANHRSMAVRASLHRQSAGSCYSTALVPFARDVFHIRFLGQSIDIPLRPHAAGHDWNLALSILGHDLEVKRVYELYLQQTSRPSFVDIGANFGSHTALFLAHRATVHSFEPLPQCHDYFRCLAQANGWHHDNWHRVALSSQRGAATLRYPQGREWLASLADTQPQAASDSLLVSDAPLQVLDAFGLDLAGSLIKIDTEGHEIEVLRGCTADISQTFGILFESNTALDRPALLAWAAERNLDILALSVSRATRCAGADFEASHSSNFFMGADAVCEEIVRKWS